MTGLYDIFLTLVLLVQVAVCSRSIRRRSTAEQAQSVTAPFGSPNGSALGPVNKEVHTIRIEMREIDESLSIEASGFLSDTAALGQRFLGNDQNYTEIVTTFKEGFYLTSSALQSDVYSIKTENADLSGCNGFGQSDVHMHYSLGDEDVPTLGFDAAGEDTIVSLPFRYKVGEQLRGSAVIPFTSLADLTGEPSGLCYVEWMGSNGLLQKIELSIISGDR